MTLSKVRLLVAIGIEDCVDRSRRSSYTFFFVRFEKKNRRRKEMEIVKGRQLDPYRFLRTESIFLFVNT